MGPPRRIVATILTALAVGVAIGTFKGDGPGLRAELGNLSAPWLLVGLLPAVTSRTLLRGALLGLVTTLVALVGFYAAATVTLAGHLGGGGYARELLVELGANRVYFLAGVVSGPLAGALGAWLGRRGRHRVPLVVGGLLAGEIAVVALVRGHRLLPAPFYFSWGVSAWGPYVAECLLGVAIVVLTIARRRRARGRTRVPA